MQKFNCKTCGAELYWDANVAALKCEYCDSEFQVSDFEDTTAAQEGQPEQQTPEPTAADEMDVATDESAQTGDLVVYQCTHCGAEIITARSTVATTCAYCGRAITLSNKMVGNFRPEAAIPFLVDNAKAVELYKAYCKKALFTPKAFLEESEIKKIKGVFVPFWLHSSNVDADVSVNGEILSSRRRGDDKVTTHKRYNISMKLTGSFSDIPTDGLKHLDDKLMDAVAPFDYQKIAPFNPAYMAGYYAEEYDETKEDAFERAKRQMDEAMKTQAIEKAGPYSGKVVSFYTAQNKNEHSKYAMLPVWLLNVTYQGKDYQFAINGETGKTVGELPISTSKLCALGGIVFAGTQILAMLFRLITML